MLNLQKRYNQVLSLNKDKLPKLMMELILSLFNIKDILFLEEYLMCVEPIAEALDKLQGEFGIYYGVLLPTLFSTEKYVEKRYHNTNIELFKPLVKVIDDGLTKRFYSILNLVDADFAIIATFIHPYFKLKWITIKKEFNNQHIHLKVKGLLSKALLSIDKHTVNEDNNEDIDDKNNFFQFANIYKENPLDLFLKSDNNSIEQIHSNDLIKQIFIKFNTPLPSSAPIERLFSYAGQINNPKRGRLTDLNFSNLVILKSNSHLF